MPPEPQFSHHKKGFINYVFCRNWAVRNPAGTRLDSSLVNKQVEVPGASMPNILHLCPGLLCGTKCLVILASYVVQSEWLSWPPVWYRVPGRPGLLCGKECMASCVVCGQTMGEDREV